ncbi:unnamed protein product [Pelagomonas calceolata]|uniref:Uncharacterized protein n=1 Tax=Pelagomonas calceolata TaxID=35677 RepID=A0A7S4A7T0_9STRA|nr:unnamed protein product [Pelagomonas calceolata]
MHRGRTKAPVLPVHKSSSSKRSSEEPKRIPALAYVAACFAIGVLIGKALRPQMAEFAPAAAPPAPAATNAPTAAATQKKLDPRVYAFYYAWYQNPATDGLWAHWNHKHLDHWDAAVRAKYPPFVHDPEKRDVGASFFPALGAYSSADDSIIEAHFAQLRKANVGVAVVSWYPPGKRDANGPEVDGLVKRLLAAAARFGLELCLHLEPWEGRTAAAQLKDVAYAVRTYGAHEAYHKIDGKCVFFAYDSYQLAARDWRAARVAANDGAFLIALALEAKHVDDYVGGAGGFDGAYSYFGATGFTQASTPSSWKGLVARASAKGGLFVPCVAPGYDDLRVRPWNGANSRGREAGAYYDRSWRAALESGAARVAVTSFNEWHEGTQIETAAAAFTPERPGVTTYLAYPSPEFYLTKTAAWVEQFVAARRRAGVG